MAWPLAVCVAAVLFVLDRVFNRHEEAVDENAHQNEGVELGVRHHLRDDDIREHACGSTRHEKNTNIDSRLEVRCTIIARNAPCWLGMQQ